MVPVAAVPHFRECLAATCPRREVFGRSLCGAGPGRDHGTYDQEGGDGDDLSTEHDPVDVDGGLPPWSGDYHLDMNVQQSYWPIYTANRLELGEPLYRTFSACIPRWREQCEKFFGFDGLWAGCAIGQSPESDSRPTAS